MKFRSLLLFIVLGLITGLFVFAFLHNTTSPAHRTVSHKTCSCCKKCCTGKKDSTEDIFYNPLNHLIVATYNKPS